MADGKYPINIWVNEERFAKLDKAGLSSMTKEAMAGLKVIFVYANDAQRDKLLKAYPGAKFDSATTKSIELLPEGEGPDFRPGNQEQEYRRSGRISQRQVKVLYIRLTRKGGGLAAASFSCQPFLLSMFTYSG